MEVGRICVKIAGRDAGKKCVIVDILDDTFVLIDGGTRRRKCNMSHLEPLEDLVDLRKGASHETVKEAFSKLGLPVWDKKKKTPAAKPSKKRKAKPKAAPVKKKAVKKKAAQKAEPKAADKKAAPKASAAKTTA